MEVYPPNAKEGFTSLNFHLYRVLAGTPVGLKMICLPLQLFATWSPIFAMGFTVINTLNGLSAQTGLDGMMV